MSRVKSRFDNFTRYELAMKLLSVMNGSVMKVI